MEQSSSSVSSSEEEKINVPTKKQAELKAAEEKRQAEHLEVLRNEEKRPGAEKSKSFIHSQTLI